MIEELFIDYGYLSINKKSENLCGDNVAIQKKDNCMVAVLADGLGSGVKANILSILTSKIISTMVINDLPIEKCVETIASILPICQERQIAYSTFTVIKVINNNVAEIIEYDNPQLIIFRDGQYYEIARVCKMYDNKKIYYSKLELQLGDLFIAVSDGAIYAGVGEQLNLGWQRDNIIEYVKSVYMATYSAKTFASIVIGKCNELYQDNPGDDTTCLALKVIKRESLNIMIGPPENPSDDKKMLTYFFSKSGKKIVCGGTTAKIVSKYLNKEIKSFFTNAMLKEDVPPTSVIEGVDLVTEGVITLSKVNYYLNDYLQDNEYYYYWTSSEDGASRLTKLLIEDCSDISFFVGKAINPAHEDVMDSHLKLKIIEEIKEKLEKLGKIVNITYF